MRKYGKFADNAARLDLAVAFPSVRAARPGKKRGGSKASSAVMKRFLFLLTALSAVLMTGCSILPELAYQPQLHNPYPQLSKIAIAPFFNLSSEPTLDGRKFALAYFNELQLVPGYEVVPVGLVEQALQTRNNRLAGPEDARRLAQDLGVDAVVIGAVTDYSPYYPPRCAIQTEWYAANPGLHNIPPGYGLPWGTREEQQIPGPLIFETEMALAKAQLATQTPRCPMPPPSEDPAGIPAEKNLKENENSRKSPGDAQAGDAVKPVGYQAPADTTVTNQGVASIRPGLPPDWPDPRGLIPPPPVSQPAPCCPTNGPVMRHTQTYNGNDSKFTEALATFYFFQDDARFGGWQNYLLRSDDFIRFCCRMHIWEMLTARGGAGETRVVWRWKKIR